MQLSRLFDIVYTLLQRESVTARELAERFEVSTRTIYRDIDALSLAGIPIYMQKGRGGGIRLMDGYTLQRSLLTDAEQRELLGALSAMQLLQVGGSTGVLSKLSALFRHSDPDWLEVDFSDWSGAQSGLFETIKAALIQQRRLAFSYTSSQGQQTERVVEPIKLLFKHRTWYLSAHCTARGEQRLFRLTRMSSPHLLDEPYNRAALTANAQPPAPDRSSFTRFVMRIDSRLAHRVYDEFAPSQVEPDGDGFLVSMSCPEDEWVYGYLLSFGDSLTLLSPPSARAIMQRKLESAQNLYPNPESSDPRRLI